MVQLILDVNGSAVALPESQKGGYVVEKKPLSEEVEMISGRIVKELRGNVWTISYQYGFFSEQMKNQVIDACEKGRREPIVCGFLTQDAVAGELKYSRFFVTKFKRPVFQWSTRLLPGGETAPVPLWGDFSVELREVKPSDTE